MRAAVFVACAACAPPFAERVAKRAEPGASVLVVDVASGATLASAGHLDKVVLPLSVVKLYIAALWWQHSLPDAIFDGHSIEDILVHSDDRGGMLLAAELRRRLGEAAVVGELGSLGLHVALPPGVDDARWNEALSIGEHDVTVTVPAVAGFLRDIARRRDGSSLRLSPQCARASSAGPRAAPRRASMVRAGISEARPEPARRT